MAISDLQRQFIDFAQGMPAIGISWKQIQSDVAELVRSLAGVNPAAPAPSLRNIPLPLYDLRYSVFLDSLSVSRSIPASLDIEMTVNVHPDGAPADVIRQYKIKSKQGTKLTFQFDGSTNEIYWESARPTPPNILPQWGPDYKAILDQTSIPDPKDDNFLDAIERPILWLTSPSFVKLVTDVMPRYSFSEIAPWIVFRPPLKIDASAGHVVFTAARASLLIGGCTPGQVDIEPDPAFPYGQQIPQPSANADHVSISVYAPRTRLVSFFAKNLEPAVLVASAGGGVIKWSYSGAVGLKELEINIRTLQGLNAILSVEAKLDFVAGARAWVDGPCGAQLFKVSASVIGKGAFAADIDFQINPKAGFLSATLRVITSELPSVDWDVHTQAPWPADAIASELFNQISKGEVKKIAGKVSQLGRWDILGVPGDLIARLGQHEKFVGHAEGLAGVSALFGAYTRGEG